MKGIVKTINDTQAGVRKVLHDLSGTAFPGDDDPFLIRLDRVTLFAEDKPYARFHYQGKVMTTLPGVMPHGEATVSQLKIEAMRQRFVDGADWRDTRLFTEYYATQLATKGRVKGAKTLDALEAVYRDEYDALYRAIRDTGFDWSPQAEMYVHVLDARDQAPLRDHRAAAGIATTIASRYLAARLQGCTIPHRAVAPLHGIPPITGLHIVRAFLRLLT